MQPNKQRGTWRRAGRLGCLALAATLVMPPVVLARDYQPDRGSGYQVMPQEPKGHKGEDRQPPRQGKPGHGQQASPQPPRQGKPGHGQQASPQPPRQGKPGHGQQASPQPPRQGKPGHGQQASPQPPRQGKPGQGRNYQQPLPPKQPKQYYGNHPRVVPKMPPKHTTYVYKGNRYYYYGGRYYRPYNRGYVVVRPPRGLFVDVLPIGFATLLLAGITYYTFAGIYYRASSGGYVVVDAPAGAVVTSPAAPAVGAPSAPIGTAVVMAALLNVRSGPGMNYSVVTTVMQGYSINVYGSAPGWLYVQAPDGQFGWVAQGFTNYTPASVPSG